MNKWDQKNIPHKGWSCQGVEDLGADVFVGEEIEYESCQMCGQEKIRFVHIMEHNQYPDTLRVGCICAEKMSNDYIYPKQKERNLKNKALRRKKWLTRTWRVSEKGNEYLNIRGYNIGVYKTKYGKWGWWVDQLFSRKDYNTKDEAKLKLFDYFQNIDKL